jgi:hypothetical protein
VNVTTKALEFDVESISGLAGDDHTERWATDEV